jgi:hypothetical protein
VTGGGRLESFQKLWGPTSPPPEVGLLFTRIPLDRVFPPSPLMQASA